MPVVFLPERVLLRATGPEAAKFLHGVVTCDVAAIEAGEARYGALLTPQGKIISDFLLYCEAPDAFLIDAPAARADELLKRLSFLRLRAKATFAKVDELAVAAVFGDVSDPPEGALYPDPRLPALGSRLVFPRAQALPGDEQAYAAHRIALAVPEGGADFAYGDAFPHEADMDQLGGVDFRKGCYVGQEVVSRMEHRTTPRNRLVAARLSAPVAAGTEIVAGGRGVGRLTSVAGDRAIAAVRLDRVSDAAGEGHGLTAGDAAVELARPDWAGFPLEYERKVSELERALKEG